MKLIQKIIVLSAIICSNTINTTSAQISNNIYASEIANFKLSQKFAADHGTSEDKFGYAVAISGKYAIAGAPYYDDKGLVDGGAAYLFDLAGGQQIQKFTADDGGTGNLFGYAVAISGKYAIIGAPYYDDKGLGDSGAVYVFDITTGQQIQKFTPNDGGAGNLFGHAVAISGKYAIAGAPYYDDKGLGDSGAVYVFDMITGQQIQKLIASDDAAGDQFGYAVAIDGKNAFIGAVNDDDKGLVDSGSAYLFDVTSGKQLRKFIASGNAAGDKFGHAVALSGKYAIAGSPYYDDKGLVDSGAAYLFDVTTGKQIQRFIASDDAGGDQFGHAVTINGNYALVGSINDDDKGLVDSGSAYLFDVKSGKQIRKFIANDDAAGDQFGYGVSISGKYAIIGSANDDGKGLINSGSAYLFDVMRGRQLQKL